MSTATVSAEVVKTSLSKLAIGNEFRSAGSQKRWMVAEVNMEAEVPYVHIFNEKVNYRLKGKCTTEEIYVLVNDNGNTLPLKSKDDWSKQIATTIKKHLDTKAPQATVTKPKTASKSTKAIVMVEAPKTTEKPKKQTTFEKVMVIHKKAAKQKAGFVDTNPALPFNEAEHSNIK